MPEEMAQWPLMMYKHDGLSLDPQHLCRSRAWNPGVGGIDKQILRAPWKTSTAKIMSSKLSERAWFKK